MSIYRRTSSTGKKSPYFTAEFTYSGQKHRRAGFVDRESARHWITSEQNKLRRGAVAFVKPMLAAAVKPLITGYADHLRGKGRDDKYCEVAESRLNRLADECGWITLANVTEQSLLAWLTEGSEFQGRAIKKRTQNQYLDIARQWGDWLASPRIAKLPSNPLANVEPLAAKHNDDYRRAGTIAELNKLLATCTAERRIYYIFRIYTPMRGRTIGRLTWRMMHLDADHPFAATPAELNKSRKPQKHAIRFEVAQELRALRKRTKAKADDLVFPDAPTIHEYKKDLKAAGVAFDKGGNNRLDFHALRTTLVQIGKNAGLTAFQLLDLMGWKTMGTMLKHYNRQSLTEDVAAAMEKLPVIGKVRRAE